MASATSQPASGEQQPLPDLLQSVGTAWTKSLFWTNEEGKGSPEPMVISSASHQHGFQQAMSFSSFASHTSNTNKSKNIQNKKKTNDSYQPRVTSITQRGEPSEAQPHQLSVVQGSYSFDSDFDDVEKVIMAPPRARQQQQKQQKHRQQRLEEHEQRILQHHQDQQQKLQQQHEKQQQENQHQEKQQQEKLQQVQLQQERQQQEQQQLQQNVPDVTTPLVERLTPVAPNNNPTVAAIDKKPPTETPDSRPRAGSPSPNLLLRPETPTRFWKSRGRAESPIRFLRNRSPRAESPRRRMRDAFTSAATTTTTENTMTIAAAKVGKGLYAQDNEAENPAAGSPAVPVETRDETAEPSSLSSVLVPLNDPTTRDDLGDVVRVVGIVLGADNAAASLPSQVHADTTESSAPPKAVLAAQTAPEAATMTTTPGAVAEKKTTTKAANGGKSNNNAATGGFDPPQGVAVPVKRTSSARKTIARSFYLGLSHASNRAATERNSSNYNQQQQPSIPSTGSMPSLKQHSPLLSAATFPRPMLSHSHDTSILAAAAPMVAEHKTNRSGNQIKNAPAIVVSKVADPKGVQGGAIDSVQPDREVGAMTTTSDADAEQVSTGVFDQAAEPGGDVVANEPNPLPSIVEKKSADQDPSSNAVDKENTDQGKSNETTSKRKKGFFSGGWVSWWISVAEAIGVADSALAEETTSVQSAPSSKSSRQALETSIDVPEPWLATAVKAEETQEGQGDAASISAESKCAQPATAEPPQPTTSNIGKVATAGPLAGDAIIQAQPEPPLPLPLLSRHSASFRSLAKALVGGGTERDVAVATVTTTTAAPMAAPQRVHQTTQDPLTPAPPAIDGNHHAQGDVKHRKRGFVSRMLRKGRGKGSEGQRKSKKKSDEPTQGRDHVVDMHQGKGGPPLEMAQEAAKLKTKSSGNEMKNIDDQRAATKVVGKNKIDAPEVNSKPPKGKERPPRPPTRKTAPRRDIATTNHRKAEPPARDKEDSQVPSAKARDMSRLDRSPIIDASGSKSKLTLREAQRDSPTPRSIVSNKDDTKQSSQPLVQLKNAEEEFDEPSLGLQRLKSQPVQSIVNGPTTPKGMRRQRSDRSGSLLESAPKNPETTTKNPAETPEKKPIQRSSTKEEIASPPIKRKGSYQVKPMKEITPRVVDESASFLSEFSDSVTDTYDDDNETEGSTDQESEREAFRKRRRRRSWAESVLISMGSRSFDDDLSVAMGVSPALSHDDYGCGFCCA